jgi:hypothetical protein
LATRLRGWQALGVDEATLSAAFVGAVADALDRAVSEGSLAAEKAAAIKADTTKLGLKGVLLDKAGGKGQGRDTKPVGLEQTLGQVIWEAAAKTLAMDPAEMKCAIVVNGQSIAELAQARRVDRQQLVNAMLGAGQAELQHGKWSRAEVDAQAPTLQRKVEEMLNMRPPKPNSGG